MQYEPPLADSNYWRMHFDGSKMETGLVVGIVLTSTDKEQLKYVMQIHFAASNNVAKYEALVHGLKVANDIRIRRIQCLIWTLLFNKCRVIGMLSMQIWY